MTGMDTAGRLTTENERVWLAWGGAGLALYGLTRGSWVGMALAAVGGFLVCHALRRPAQRASQAPLPSVPPADSPNADAFLREALEGSLPAAGDSRRPADSPLTPEERGRTEVTAYYHALERGGGRLPPYDPWQAAEDYRRAAERARARP